MKNITAEVVSLLIKFRRFESRIKIKHQSSVFFKPVRLTSSRNVEQENIFWLLVSLPVLDWWFKPSSLTMIIITYITYVQPIDQTITTKNCTLLYISDVA